MVGKKLEALLGEARSEATQADYELGSCAEDGQAHVIKSQLATVAARLGQAEHLVFKALSYIEDNGGELDDG